MLPAQRLYWLLGLGLASAPLAAAAFGLPASLVGLFFYDGLLFSLALWDVWRVRGQRVQVSRLPLAKLSIGRENLVTLTVRSAGRPSKIQLRDGYPTNFLVPSSMLSATLAPDSSQELTYPVYPRKRGEYHWGDLQVRQLGAWGLAWHDWKVPAQATVPVYPDLVGLRSLSIRLTLEKTGTMRQIHTWGRGTEFAELREYSRGDDSRAIDWKATARCHRPFVRVLEPEREQTLIILLDRGRLMTAQVQGITRFDWGLNAALSLALAGLYRGDCVGVGVFDRQLATWIPPQRGQHHLGKLVERLTPLQPVLLEPDYAGAVSHLVQQQARRALVVLITDLVDATASAELLAAMGRLVPRYLPFCVTLRDPQVDAIAHTSTPTVSGAYRRAVALDLLAQRQVAFAHLQQRGVLVLDAPADRLSEPLVNHYLQLKAQNRL